MFSTIVISAIFASTSAIIFIIIWDFVIPESETRKLRRQLEDFQRGHRNELVFWKLVVVFLIWFLTGWYIFG